MPAVDGVDFKPDGTVEISKNVKVEGNNGERGNLSIYNGSVSFTKDDLYIHVPKDPASQYYWDSGNMEIYSWSWPPSDTKPATLKMLNGKGNIYAEGYMYLDGPQAIDTGSGKGSVAIYTQEDLYICSEGGDINFNGLVYSRGGIYMYPYYFGIDPETGWWNYETRDVNFIGSLISKNYINMYGNKFNIQTDPAVASALAGATGSGALGVSSWFIND